MNASQALLAVAAATATASSLGLSVSDSVVLHNSNKLTLRLIPCDVVARVAPAAEHAAAQFEVDLAQRLVAAGCPVAGLERRVEPRVYDRDEFALTLWAYREPIAFQVLPVDYAEALMRLHGGMRKLDFPTPHFTDRIDE